MPINVIVVQGSKGGRRLKEAVESASAGQSRLGNLTVCWGVNAEGLNGMPRLNGLEQLRKLKSARQSAYAVPEFTDNYDTAMRWYASGIDVFGRKLNHTKGKDIVRPSKPREFMRRDYWVKVVPNVHEEWRIHAMGDRVIARGLKVYEGSKRIPPIIRSRRLGWRMRHDIEPSDNLRDAARAAIAALDYDFGAVDILLTDRGGIYVLEVNQQPGLDDYTAERYALAFVRKAKKMRG